MCVSTDTSKNKEIILLEKYLILGTQGQINLKHDKRRNSLLGASYVSSFHIEVFLVEEVLLDKGTTFSSTVSCISETEVVAVSSSILGGSLGSVTMGMSMFLICEHELNTHEIVLKKLH